MIKFKKNAQLDMTMKNLLLSMIEVSNYLDEILPYTGKVLTPKKERELIQILKKHAIPHTNLKYDVHRLTENPYYKDIKLDDVKTDTVRYEESMIKKNPDQYGLFQTHWQIPFSLSPYGLF